MSAKRQPTARGRRGWVLSRPPSGGRQTACPSPRGCDAPAGPLLSGRPSARGQALTTSPAFRSLQHKAGAQCSEPAAAQTHCSRPPRRPGADAGTAPPTDSPSCCPPPDLTSVSVSSFPVWGGPELPALPPQGLWAATAAGRLLSALLRASEQVLRRSVFSGPPDTRCFPRCSCSKGTGPRAAGGASLPPIEGRPDAWLLADGVRALWFRCPGGRLGLRGLGRAEPCATSNTSFPETGH